LLGYFSLLSLTPLQGSLVVELVSYLMVSCFLVLRGCIFIMFISSHILDNSSLVPQGRFQNNKIKWVITFLKACWVSIQSLIILYGWSRVLFCIDLEIEVKFGLQECVVSYARQVGWKNTLFEIHYTTPLKRGYLFHLQHCFSMCVPSFLDLFHLHELGLLASQP
jgi:hypothetical protein